MTFLNEVLYQYQNFGTQSQLRVKFLDHLHQRSIYLSGLDEVMCVGLGDDFKQVALNVAFHTCVRGENRVSEKYNCIRINTLDREKQK